MSFQKKSVHGAQKQGLLLLIGFVFIAFTAITVSAGGPKEGREKGVTAGTAPQKAQEWAPKKKSDKNAPQWDISEVDVMINACQAETGIEMDDVLNFMVDQLIVTEGKKAQIYPSALHAYVSKGFWLGDVDSEAYASCACLASGLVSSIGYSVKAGTVYHPTRVDCAADFSLLGDYKLGFDYGVLAQLMLTNDNEFLGDVLESFLMRFFEQLRSEHLEKIP